MINAKMIFKIVVSFFLFLSMGQAATQDFTVPVPKSQIAMPQEAAPKEDHPFIELQISSWSPTQFGEDSQLANTSSFSTVIPMTSLSYGSKLFQGSGYDLFSKLGASFTQLQRSGILNYEDNKLKISQDLNIYQLQLGLEASSLREIVKNVVPLAGLYLLPTWSQSNSSEFNDGTSELDLLAKISLGLSWKINPVAEWLGMQEAALEFGAEGTEGLSGANFANAGLWVGTRIGWK